MADYCLILCAQKTPILKKKGVIDTEIITHHFTLKDMKSKKLSIIPSQFTVQAS
jgi:hypothetical protein